MKKLIIAAAFVAASICANAATINWSATMVANSPSYTSGTPSYMAYFIVGGSEDLAAYVSGLSSASTAAATVQSIINDATYSKANTYIAATAKNNFLSNGNTTDLSGSQSAFVIILDAADASAQHYIATDVLTTTISTTAATPFAYGSLASSTWTAVAVPEPTSGLLLLLGMAGLALRRKRA